MIMKKTLLGIALAAAAMCAMTSCEGGRADHRRADGDRKDVYTGVLPAADCAGIPSNSIMTTTTIIPMATMTW